MPKDMEIFRQETLTELVQKYKSAGTPLMNMGLLPVTNIGGKSKQWDEKTQLEDVGAFTGDNDPANHVDEEVLGNRSAKLITSFDEDAFDGEELLQIRKAGSEEQETIENKVAEKMARMSDIHARQDEVLLSGAIQGSATVKIKALTHTIDYGFHAANHFKIGGGGGNGTIPLSWANVGAKIHKDMDAIQKVPREEAGRELKGGIALMGPDVKTALFSNPEVRELVGGTAMANTMLVSGEIPNLYGMRWVEVLHYYKHPVTGARTYHIPAGKVVFLPAMDRSWGEFCRGTVAVMNSSGQMTLVQGAGAWSKDFDNPPKRVLYRRYRRLPIIKVPRAIVTAQVIPA
jgi:hypothetical protein